MLTSKPVDPSLSHSYAVKTPNGMDIGYDDGSGASGDYSYDDISFAGLTLKKALLSVGTKGSISTSIMGIGPDIDFSGYPPALGPTTLDALVSNNFTDSKMFSVWLEDDAVRGSVLFGGIDESKFDTETGLVTVDMIPDPEGPQYPYSSYMAAVTGMSTTIADQVLTYSMPSQAPNATISASTYLPMCIDTGTGTIMVPNHIFDEINYHIGTSQNLPIPGGNALLCSQAENKTLKESTFSWTIGDPKNRSTSITYNMSFADLVIPALHPLTRKAYTMQNPDGDGEVDLCTFGLQPVGDDGGDSIMGAAGIKRMFVVFDQDRKQLSFGRPVSKASGNSGTPVDVPMPSNPTVPQTNSPITTAGPTASFAPSSTPKPSIQPGSPSNATRFGHGPMFALTVGMFVTFVCTLTFGA